MMKKGQKWGLRRPQGRLSMTILYMEPLGRAWSRMKTALFKPFDLHKWFVVGFNAFLAALMEASNGGSGARAGKEGNFGEFIHFPQTAWQWLMSHPAWAIAILFAVLVAMAVVVLLTWVSSRGVFMFLDNVVRDSVEIAKPWRDYAKEGNSLFVWRLLFGLVTIAAFAFILTLFFIKGAALYDSGAELSTLDGGSWLLPLIGLGLFFLAIVLVWGYIVLFLKDFVAALMYRNRISCFEAWRLFLGIFKKNPLHFIGYGIIIFFLMLAFVCAVVVAGLATCCIGFFLLIIPYISTVVTLPVWYAYRAFSLEFLAQFGPEYDVFKRQEGGSGAAPAVPAATAV
jgi:hypothetical protein